MKTTDVDYTDRAVDRAGRKSNLSMFMVMLGFTFFSASMWVGQQLSAGLDWWDFVWALLLGGLILAAYTGSLGFIGAESGLSLDMLARRSFGTKGSWLPSAMISFTQIGWFGVGLAMFAIPVAKELMGLEVTPDHMPLEGYLLVVFAGILMTASAYYGIRSLTLISYIAVPAVAILGTLAMILAIRRGDMGLVEQFSQGTKSLGVIAGAGLVVGSFVSGGTATPNFTRFAKNARVGLWTTVVAFFIGNSLMFLFGAVSSIYVGGNDIFEVMLNLNLFYLAVLVLGLNIWTTNDNALYSAGLGLGNITGLSKKAMVIASGKLSLLKFVWKNGRCHASPNSGYPEAALAGILNCRFGGPHIYFGELFDKPYIGENDRELTTQDMHTAVRINRTAELLMLALTSVVVIFI